jgi:hypothetical protein
MKENFAESDHTQIWIIGFSKSGIGAQDLILRHPDVFALAASWDFPAGMRSGDQFGADSLRSYGTNENFLQHYKPSPEFIENHAGPFRETPRIWTGGSQLFGPDVYAYDRLLGDYGIKYTTERPRRAEHAWDSGWLPLALAALRADSLALGV